MFSQIKNHFIFPCASCRGNNKNIDLIVSMTDMFYLLKGIHMRSSYGNQKINWISPLVGHKHEKWRLGLSLAVTSLLV